MTNLKISVDGVTAVAALKDDAAPKSTEKILGALPLTTTLVHASRSGNCAVAHDDSLADASLPIEGQVSMYYPNMVAYDPVRGYIVLAYGQGQARSSTCTHWVTYLGEIVEGAAELAAKVQETREGGGTLEIRFERGE